MALLVTRLALNLVQIVHDMLRRYEIKILAVAALGDQEATRTLGPRSGLGTDGEAERAGEKLGDSYNGERVVWRSLGPAKRVTTDSRISTSMSVMP